MEKLKMSTKNHATQNIQKLKKMFPNCIVEKKDESGNTVLSVDFGMLSQELSDVLCDPLEERYVLTWPEKRKTILNSNTMSTNTLRPLRNKSVDFENTKNVYIEGDNLEVLKLLRETYLGAVKLIYIDPPYNSGSDLLYKNNYEIDEELYEKISGQVSEEGYLMTHNTESRGKFHTDWLNMMYARIKVAYDLLSPEGCMVIAIDHNELANLIKIADEIFYEDNRLGIVTVVHKPEGRNQEKFFATSNEFALFYAKDKSKFSFTPAILDDEILKTYDREDEKGKYRLNNYIRLGGGNDNLRVNKPNFYYPVFVSEDCKDISSVEKSGYIAVYPNTATQERTWKTKRETFIERLKAGEILAEKDKNGQIVVYEKYRIDNGQLIKTHWTDKKYNAIYNGTKILEDLMGTKTFDFPKSLYLLIDILKITTDKNAIVLDFFSGSATTAHAVMQLNSEDGGNRKFILVQLPAECDEKSNAYKAGYHNICEIGQERIRRAGIRIKNENKNADLDVGFRVFKMDSSNMNEVFYSPDNMPQSLLDLTVDNIKPDRTGEDLLFQVMLEFDLQLDKRLETKTIQDKEVFMVDGNSLIACFEPGVTDELVKEISKLKPTYAVFRDLSFTNDSNKINIGEIFKMYSPNTEIKVL